MVRKIISGIMSILLVLSMFSLLSYIQPVRASGTIYIRADGSIDPPDAPISTVDNITYILTGNVTSDTDGIVIERDNIVLNGAGYTVTQSGPGSAGTGITLTSRSNVTVRNMAISWFLNGIWLNSSSGNTLVGNTLVFNDYDIFLNYSSDNTLSGNTVTLGNFAGIFLYYFSDNNILSGNTITNCRQTGIYLDSSSGNTLIGNTVVNQGRSTGIGIDYSSGNTLSGNNIASNWYGIEFYSSSGNTMVGNTVTANGVDGIMLGSSPNNSIFHNSFVSNTIQAYTMGSNDTWDDGYPSGGNYWSDYAGGDGARALWRRNW